MLGEKVLNHELYTRQALTREAVTNAIDAYPTVLTLVRSCVHGLRAEAAGAGIRLDAVAKSPTHARCAPEKVERVVRNLVTNALRHTPKNGRVVVSVAQDNGHVEVLVEDTGEGLTPEVRARMFDRFYRAVERDGEGFGLGLSIVGETVQALRGTLDLESTPGVGTTVRVSLPGVEEEA